MDRRLKVACVATLLLVTGPVSVSADGDAAIALVECLDEPDVKDQSNCIWGTWTGLGLPFSASATTHAGAKVDGTPSDVDSCLVSEALAHAAGKTGLYDWHVQITMPDGTVIEDSGEDEALPSPLVRELEFTIAPGETVSASSYIRIVNLGLDWSAASNSFTCPDVEELLDLIQGEE